MAFSRYVPSIRSEIPPFSSPAFLPPPLDPHQLASFPGPHRGAPLLSPPLKVIIRTTDSGGSTTSANVCPAHPPGDGVGGGVKKREKREKESREGRGRRRKLFSFFFAQELLLFLLLFSCTHNTNTRQVCPTSNERAALKQSLNLKGGGREEGKKYN